MLGTLRVGFVVLIRVELMTTRGAAFTELMRSARTLVFSECAKPAAMLNRLRLPIAIRTIRTPLEVD
jgi:hypothetical protein